MKKMARCVPVRLPSGRWGRLTRFGRYRRKTIAAGRSRGRTRLGRIGMIDITKAHVVHDWTYERPLLAARFDPQSRFVVTSAENNLLQRFNLPGGEVEVFCGSLAQNL